MITDITTHLYHICRRKDIGNLNSGYLGISINPLRRWATHKSQQKNQHLQRAYEKYNDIVEYVVTSGTDNYCRYLEVVWRPEQRIGWNIAVGGGLTPDVTGRIMTEEHKRKIGEAQKGKTISEESRKKMSKAHSGKERPWRKGVKLNIDMSKMKYGEDNPNFGRRHREDSLQKMRKPKGKQPESICPFCDKTGRGGAMKRYHFNNCKLK